MALALTRQHDPIMTIHIRVLVRLVVSHTETLTGMQPLIETLPLRRVRLRALEGADHLQVLVPLHRGHPRALLLLLVLAVLLVISSHLQVLFVAGLLSHIEPPAIVLHMLLPTLTMYLLHLLLPPHCPLVLESPAIAAATFYHHVVHPLVLHVLQASRPQNSLIDPLIIAQARHTLERNDSIPTFLQDRVFLPTSAHPRRPLSLQRPSALSNPSSTLSSASFLVADMSQVVLV